MPVLTGPNGNGTDNPTVLSGGVSTSVGGATPIYDPTQPLSGGVSTFNPSDPSSPLVPFAPVPNPTPTDYGAAGGNPPQSGATVPISGGTSSGGGILIGGANPPNGIVTGGSSGGQNLGQGTYAYPPTNVQGGLGQTNAFVPSGGWLATRTVGNEIQGQGTNGQWYVIGSVNNGNPTSVPITQVPVPTPTPTGTPTPTPTPTPGGATSLPPNISVVQKISNPSSNILNYLTQAAQQQGGGGLPKGQFPQSPLMQVPNPQHAPLPGPNFHFAPTPDQGGAELTPPEIKGGLSPSLINGQIESEGQGAGQQANPTENQPMELPAGPAGAQRSLAGALQPAQQGRPDVAGFPGYSAEQLLADAAGTPNHPLIGRLMGNATQSGNGNGSYTPPGTMQSQQPTADNALEQWKKMHPPSAGEHNPPSHNPISDYERFAGKGAGLGKSPKYEPPNLMHPTSPLPTIGRGGGEPQEAQNGPGAGWVPPPPALPLTGENGIIPPDIQNAPVDATLKAAAEKRDRQLDMIKRMPPSKETRDAERKFQLIATENDDLDKQIKAVQTGKSNPVPSEMIDRTALRAASNGRSISDQVNQDAVDYAYSPYVHKDPQTGALVPNSPQGAVAYRMLKAPSIREDFAGQRAALMEQWMNAYSGYINGYNAEVKRVNDGKAQWLADANQRHSQLNQELQRQEGIIKDERDRDQSQKDTLNEQAHQAYTDALNARKFETGEQYDNERLANQARQMQLNEQREGRLAQGQQFRQSQALNKMQMAANNFAERRRQFDIKDGEAIQNMLQKANQFKARLEQQQQEAEDKNVRFGITEQDKMTNAQLQRDLRRQLNTLMTEPDENGQSRKITAAQGRYETQQRGMDIREDHYSRDMAMDALKTVLGGLSDLQKGVNQQKATEQRGKEQQINQQQKQRQIDIMAQRAEDMRRQGDWKGYTNMIDAIGKFIKNTGQGAKDIAPLVQEVAPYVAPSLAPHFAGALGVTIAGDSSASSLTEPPLKPAAGKPTQAAAPQGQWVPKSMVDEQGNLSGKPPDKDIAPKYLGTLKPKPGQVFDFNTMSPKWESAEQQQYYGNNTNLGQQWVYYVPKKK
jgi:hypothetical protein